MSDRTIKTQIASAIDLLVHIERFPDGKRRVTSVTELVGFSEGVLSTQDLFGFDDVTKKFTCAGLMPHRIHKARRLGLDHMIADAITEH